MNVIVNKAVTDSLPLNLDRFYHQAPITLSSNEYLDRQAAQESNARSYPRRFPIAISRAEGIFIEDTKGQLFIDCLAGAGTLALGHNHPDIHQALKTHLDSMAPLHTLDITTPVKDAFVNKLFEALPDNFAQQAKVQFCGPTGADAVEAALKLAKTATGRRSVLAFSGAYHGMTHATLGIMGDVSVKEPVHNLMAEVQFLPFPYLYRCPMGLEAEQSIDSNLHYIENMLNDSHSGVLPPAALIVEAIQGEGGAIPAPTRWLKELRRITKEHNIPLILDEVQCGMGRSGKMFAFEHADIEPDIIVISKAIGGGLPLSVIVYNQELDTWGPGAHTGTFRGNQLAMVAGKVVLETIAEQNLCKNAEKMGELLKAHLLELQAECSYIGDVRGQGLMLGVEIVDPRENTSPAPTFKELASIIQRQCLQNGLILESGGRNDSTLRFLPPLIIKEDEVNLVAGIFKKSVIEGVNQL
ncbi:diaminobutyrate--2-oxoglutarate transaminase [Oceanospirillum beijerinckii]|uniref:diaminobutyrate--2-oxoglutarate transaminase n=1 Tax=Oceanospirillum beijerinckii TaxID=64976 RepID=UPI00040882FE|nr:diaminobutyrate--2-oxoglutarate transaminase [Oceanospirillum beijerinckii]